MLAALVVGGLMFGALFAVAAIVCAEQAEEQAAPEPEEEE